MREYGRLKQSTVFQTISYDDVHNCKDHELDAAGVSGASEMRVNNFVFVFIYAFKLMLNIGSGFVVSICS